MLKQHLFGLRYHAAQFSTQVDQIVATHLGIHALQVFQRHQHARFIGKILHAFHYLDHRLQRGTARLIFGHEIQVIRCCTIQSHHQRQLGAGTGKIGVDHITDRRNPFRSAQVGVAPGFDQHITRPTDLYFGGVIQQRTGFDVTFAGIADVASRFQQGNVISIDMLQQ